MFKKAHYILTFLAFFISLCLYTLTMAPTTSFWDCGEFIASSFIMGVPHPPGAPLFLILGNVFSNIPIFSDIGARVNFLSPLVSALSVLFLYLIIVNLIEKFKGTTKHISDFIIINISAFIASLTFAITDSHWFNAVESEVYSMSTFFTAIVLWMILKWADKSDKGWNARYLLLISYMIGLATGVHLLNLLALPFVGLIIYFKKYSYSLKGFIITMISVGVCFIIIYVGFILGLPDLVSKLNSINILIIFTFFILLSIVTLHLSKYNHIVSNVAKISSIIAISIIILFVYNKLFIKADNEEKLRLYTDQIELINEQYKLFSGILSDFRWDLYDAVGEGNAKTQKNTILHRLYNNSSISDLIRQWKTENPKPKKPPESEAFTTEYVDRKLIWENRLNAYRVKINQDYNNKYPKKVFIDNNYGEISETECMFVGQKEGMAIWYGNEKTNIAYCGNGILDWKEGLKAEKKTLLKKQDLIPQLYSIETSNHDINHIKNNLFIIRRAAVWNDLTDEQKSELTAQIEDVKLIDEEKPSKIDSISISVISKTNSIYEKYFNPSSENLCLLDKSPDIFPETIIIEKSLSNTELNIILNEYFESEKINLTSMQKTTLSGKIEKINEEKLDVFVSRKIKEISYIKLLLFQSSKLLFGLISILLALFVILFYYLYYKKNQPIYALKIFFSCILLVVIGYSTYGVIFIRAGQSPRINENTPDNLERALAYINRDQYGAVKSFNPSSAIRNSNSGHWKRWAKTKENPTFEEKANFIWNYQIKEMYLRYFAWQFIGRSDKNEKPWLITDLDGQLVGNRKLDGVDFFRYGLPLAFIFGLIGIIFHFTRDWKRALAVLSVFLATGIMVILYLNQYDPQPRERDYSYVGSFFAFSIWIGFGIAMIQEKIKDFFEDSNISSFISITISCFIFMLMPLTMLASDYKEHNRTGNYVAWDYGYNLLNSCDPNAILFTNGDNDTFPLWYLQEVEKIRTDVRVINLSLLNTPWYIKQLINDEPKLNLNFCNNALLDDIYNIEKDPLISTYEGYNLCAHKGMEFKEGKIACQLNELNFDIPLHNKQYLRAQDYMILQILKDELNNKPIYFAATVSPNNQVGLKAYLQMEGMTYRVMTSSDFENSKSKINYSKMKQNLMHSNMNDTIRTSEDYMEAINKGRGIYRFTNLNNPDIYFNGNIKRLVQNYRIGYVRMAQEQLSLDNKKEAAKIVEIMNNNFPKEILPLDPWIGFELLEKIYTPLNYIDEQKNMLDYLVNSNVDINVQLISILKSFELKYYDKVEDYITRFVINDKISYENKIALFFEMMNRGYHNSINNLINDITQEYINDKYTDLANQSSIYALLGSLLKVENSNENNFISNNIITIAQKLLIVNYGENLTVDSQKDLGDILARYMDGKVFIDFCNKTFKNHKIEGLFYSLVNLYMTNHYYEEALIEIDKWLIDNKNNKRMINKRNKILEKIKQ